MICRLLKVTVLYFFSLLSVTIRRPTRFTLFPYTTLFRSEAEQVSRRRRLERPLRLEQLPELRDVDLERLCRGRRRPLAPEPVDQALARERLVRMQQEERQERPLLRAAHPQRAAFAKHLQRSEQPKLHPNLANAALSEHLNPLLTGFLPVALAAGASLVATDRTKRSAKGGTMNAPSTNRRRLVGLAAVVGS